MKLSILVKTYNEERNIQRCLDAVLCAIDGMSEVEVIVADSLSTDETIAIASRYPVTIVQMTAACDRGCGAGVQLGFQHARGEYIYLLDGDMELQGGFLREALRQMENDAQLGGIGGILEDSQSSNYFDRYRLKNKPAARPGEVEWLAGGGLYRRAAILDAGGYAGNRNLKAFEEAELGLRLRSRRWRLVRLPTVAVVHTGHAASTLSLVGRHWRSGRLDAAGILLKSAVGHPWLARVMRLCMHPLAVLLYWPSLLLLMLPPVPGLLPAGMAVLGVALGVALIWKKRSLQDALFSIFLWHVGAAGLLRGMLASHLVSPLAAIPSRTLREASDGGLMSSCTAAGARINQAPLA